MKDPQRGPGARDVREIHNDARALSRGRGKGERPVASGSDLGLLTLRVGAPSNKVPLPSTSVRDHGGEHTWCAHAGHAGAIDRPTNQTTERSNDRPTDQSRSAHRVLCLSLAEIDSARERVLIRGNVRTVAERATSTVDRRAEYRTALCTDSHRSPVISLDVARSARRYHRVELHGASNRMLSLGQDVPPNNYSSGNVVLQGAPCSQCRDLCPAGYVPHFWRKEMAEVKWTARVYRVTKGDPGKMLGSAVHVMGGSIKV
ncbi:hypothetical protein HN011_003201 [Eciton burchellii]|nr:hypothetical protein HN011_003201 [Eciton burchellii]